MATQRFKQCWSSNSWQDGWPLVTRQNRVHLRLLLTKRTLTDAYAWNLTFFVHACTCMCATDLRRCHGNAFAQGMHGAVLLGNHTNCLGVGMAFPNIEQQGDQFNHVLCLGLQPANCGTPSTLANKMSEMCMFMTGYGYEDLCHSTNADFDALRVDVELAHEREGCDCMLSMHNIIRAAVGDSGSSRPGESQKPFPGAQRLLAKAKACAEYFCHGTERINDLWKIGDGPAPKLRPDADLSPSKVADRQSMVEWLLLSLAELEAVMEIAASATALLENETHATCALGPIIKQRVLDTCRAATVSVVDLDRIGSQDVLPRIDRHVSELTEMGKTALFRAQLEMERQYCGNQALELSGFDGSSKVPMSKRELLSSLLDPRTCHTMPDHLPANELKSAVYMLQDYYVDYAMQVHKYDAPPATTTSDVSTDERLHGWPPRKCPNDEEENPVVVKERLQREASRCWERWKKAMLNFSQPLHWKATFPSLDLPDEPDIIDDLSSLPMQEFYAGMKAVLRNGRPKFGLWPEMALHSRACVGPLSAVAFHRHTTSTAQSVVDDVDDSLSHHEATMLTSLEMNRDYAASLEKLYPDVSSEELTKQLTSQVDAHGVMDLFAFG